MRHRRHPEVGSYLSLKLFLFGTFAPTTNKIFLSPIPSKIAGYCDLPAEHFAIGGVGAELNWPGRKTYYEEAFQSAVDQLASVEREQCESKGQGTGTRGVWADHLPQEVLING